MSSIRYDKIPVIIQYGSRTEKILAYDCSLSEAAELQPVYSIGKKGIAEQTPAGARTASISFSYTPVLTGFVNEKYKIKGDFNIINHVASGLKNSKKAQTSGISIRFGGISGEGLLSSYSFQLGPYAPVECSVNFELFGSGQDLPVTGELQSQTIQRNEQSAIASGVGHSAFSAFMTAGSPATITSSDETGILKSVDYSINFDYEPVYKLGQEFPSTFLFHSASEEVRVSENLYETGIEFTGKAENFHLNIKSIDNANTISVNMDKPVLANAQLRVGAGGIAETEKTIRSFY
jgi:hypothetical protein|tara:strand:+ start:394 stop:1269 length:876 start_codon:yes stop_codon:yes gene_type:complete